MNRLEPLIVPMLPRPALDPIYREALLDRLLVELVHPAPAGPVDAGQPRRLYYVGGAVVGGVVGAAIAVGAAVGLRRRRVSEPTDADAA